MKIVEKNEAINLRKKGMSMGDISKQLKVSKSSVSYWVRNVELTKKQRSKLNKNGHSIEAIEKRRISRIANTQAKRDVISKTALKEATKLVSNPLWCVGVALYWGEGGKTQNIARIANSDPTVIKMMMTFFRGVCHISEEKFHGHIHTFDHRNVRKAEEYWSNVSGIDKSNFFKTYKKKSSSSKHKRNTLPYGTFQIYIHDTDFFFRMMAWIEYLKTSKL